MSHGSNPCPRGSKTGVSSILYAVPGGLQMILSPKAQGLQLSTEGLQAHMAQPPRADDVALFLHTSGVFLTSPAPPQCLAWLATGPQRGPESAEQPSLRIPKDTEKRVLRYMIEVTAYPHGALQCAERAGHAGTTSKPKGVPLTHANLAASLHNIAATYQLTARDRSLLVMPLFHVHGLMAGQKQGAPPSTLCCCKCPQCTGMTSKLCLRG